MSLELVLFLIFAVVAIFTAAMMLISRNAVHSALFLVTNFICVAFFYLLLNAPFLAMIQITVYAGAIMVAARGCCRPDGWTGCPCLAAATASRGPGSSSQ